MATVMRDFPLCNRDLDLIRHPERIPKPILKNGIFRFVNSKYSEDILSSMKKQRENNQFLDTVLIVGGNKKAPINAHRCLLSAFSPYFETYFRNTDLNSFDGTIELPDLNKKSVEMLVDYAYSGYLDISQECVQDLLADADFLCLDLVREQCSKYLLDNINTSNCWVIYQIPSLYSLKTKVAQYICEHFESIVLSGEIYEESPEVVFEILKDDELLITDGGYPSNIQRQEEHVLQFILEYFNRLKDPQFLPMFLKEGVRLALIDSSVLQFTRNNILIQQSPVSLELFDQAIKLQSFPRTETKWNTPRSLKRLKYEPSRILATTSAIVSEIPSETFNDARFLENAPQRLLYMTKMRIHVRRWDGRPIIGGIQVTYNTGDSVLHGSDNYGFEVEEVSLDLDERVVWMEVGAGWMIDSFKFRTNKDRIFGPYGGGGGAKILILPPFRNGFLAYVDGQVDMSQGFTAVRGLKFHWGFYDYASETL